MHATEQGAVYSLTIVGIPENGTYSSPSTLDVAPNTMILVNRPRVDSSDSGRTVGEGEENKTLRFSNDPNNEDPTQLTSPKGLPIMNIISSSADILLLRSLSIALTWTAMMRDLDGDS